MNLIYLPLLLAPAALEAPADLDSPKAALQLAAHNAIQESAARELDELSQALAIDASLPHREEWQGLIAHYRRTGDATHASEPHRYTLLHLACLYTKPCLVGVLLEAGADAKARHLNPPNKEYREYTPGDTPLLMLFRRKAEAEPADNLMELALTAHDVMQIAIIGGLDKAGADIPEREGSSALSLSESEAVILRLLQLGADPGESGGVYVQGTAVDQRQDFFMSEALAGHLHVMEYMLERGMVSLYGAVNVEGDSYLGMLCRQLAGDGADEERFARLAPAIALLLRLHADTRFAGLAHPGELRPSPADYIFDNPRLLAYLREQGIKVYPTFRRLRPECLEADLAALPEPVHPQLDEDKAAELWRLMAELLPTPATNETGRQARRRCLELMAQIDAVRTREYVMQHKLWEDDAFWQPANRAAQALLADALIRLSHAVMLPGEWTLDTATRVAAGGNARCAHELVALLGSNAGNAELLDRLCEDASQPLAISAPAWAARVERAGLGLRRARSGAFEDAFAEDTEAREQAGTLASTLRCLGSDQAGRPRRLALDRFSFNRLSKEKRLVLGEMLEAGGETATATYLRELEAVTQHLDSLAADASDAVRQPLEARLHALLAPDNTDTATFTIERTLAKWIWEHRHELHPFRITP